MYKPDKLLYINVQHTVIKGYHFSKIKSQNALFVEVDTMFTHMHIKTQLSWMPPFNEQPAKLYNCICICKELLVSNIVGLYIHVGQYNTKMTSRI